jgi:hypothetical protein
MQTSPLPKSLRCAGYVLGGILLMGALLAGFGTFAAALIWLSIITASLLGLSEFTQPFFFVGYMCVLGGGFLGAAACRDARS